MEVTASFRVESEAREQLPDLVFLALNCDSWGFTWSRGGPALEEACWMTDMPLISELFDNRFGTLLTEWLESLQAP